MRKRPPQTRTGTIHHVVIEDVDLYITLNRYDDEPRVAEIFLNVAKQGSTLQGLADGWAIMLSMALQYGVELRKVVDKFSGHSFPPNGKTSDPNIPECTSILDYVVQLLDREELGYQN